MNAGTLNKHITVQSRTATQNEYGEQVQTWGTYASCWAKVEPLRGEEWFAGRASLEAKAATSKIDTRFITRYKSGINTAMRILYNSIAYNIESVINVNEANRKLEIMASRITT